MSEKDELKPCPNPWCEENAPAWRMGASKRFVVECPCGIHSPWADTSGEAIAAWNHRIEPEAADRGVSEALEKLWRKHDPHLTSVIRGVPDDFYGDDPRINIFDEKVDAGEEPRLTIGLFLGNHKWAMQRFSPEQCAAVAGMLLSKPSVKAVLQSLRSEHALPPVTNGKMK